MLETSMATPLGIRIGCNSFLRQDFLFFFFVLGVLGLRLLSPISRIGIMRCLLSLFSNVF